MGPTGDTINVIQIHPTKRCNLRCKHCYSTSGPRYSSELSIESLLSILEDAWRERYNGVGVSGGEPLLYPPLPMLLESARRCGFLTTVTTNGLLIDPRRLDQLTPHLSLLAISVDGSPESHDRMRSMPGAFEKMRRKLEHVRAAKVPFGFIFTLTLENLHELDFVARMAAAEGASLLQVHPLEGVGRAREYSLDPPDELELAYGFLEVARLQTLYRNRLVLQYDVADRVLIESEPCRAFAIPPPDSVPGEDVALSRLVSPLVVQDDGWVVPVQYGFSRAYAIGHISCGSLQDQAARWKSERYLDFLALSRRVWTALRPAPAHLPFTNWYAAITTASADTPGPAPIPAPT